MTKKSKLVLSAIATLLVAFGVWTYSLSANTTPPSVVVQKVEKPSRALVQNQPSPEQVDYDHDEAKEYYDYEEVKEHDDKDEEEDYYEEEHEEGEEI